MDKLTIGLANKIYARGKVIESKNLTGKRRELVENCIKYYGLTELEALNITNGFRLEDYVMLQNRRYEQMKK